MILFDVNVIDYSSPIYINGRLEGYNITKIVVEAFSQQDANEIANMMGYDVR